MTELNIGEKGESLYTPYLIADREGLVSDARVLNTPPGVLFASGIIPGASIGGAVMLGGQVWGIDHLASVTDGRDILLSGTDKAAIDAGTPERQKRNIGTIEEEGVITITNLAAERVFFGAIVKHASPWIKEEYTRLGLRCYIVGDMAIGIPKLGSDLAKPLDLDVSHKSDESMLVRIKSY